MRIAVANDHTAVVHKRAIADHLRQRGHEVLDVGVSSDEASVDYPDFAGKAAQALVDGAVERAVLICGTGIGVSITANKFPGVRCGLAHDVATARLAAEHNRAQALALGARVVPVDVALAMVDAWLDATFEARHQRRLDKIATIEHRFADALRTSATKDQRPC